MTKSFHFYSFTQKLMMSSSFSFKLDCGGSFPMNSNWKKRLGKNAPKTPLFTNSYSFCHIMVTIRFLLTWTQSLNLTLDLCWINRKKCNELWVVLNKEKKYYNYIIEGPLISRIKNSFKLHRVYHILRHFYYTTMQKLCEFKALYRPEIQCKCHKGNP